MARTPARWNPFTERLPDFSSIFPRDLFGRLAEDGGLEVEWQPRSDITETDDELVVRAELPGVDPADIDVEVREGLLRIRGEKKAEKEEEKEGRRYSERFFGSFERSIALPADIDADSVDAQMTNGVLTVRVPKPRAQSPEVKKVDVKKG